MIPCGENGYALSFGYKYCNIYLAMRDEFIQKEWQDGVRSCLQREMLSKLNQFSGRSCEKVEEWGFGSHTGCYLRPIPDNWSVGFCKLPAVDIFKIMWAAKGTVFTGAVWTQFDEMIKNCAGHYMQDVREDVGNFVRKLKAKFESIEEGIEEIELTAEGIKRWLDTSNGDNIRIPLL